jgi:ribosome-associated translation inhibitor RaiA
VHLERAVGSKKQGDVWRAEVTIDHEGSRFQAESTKAKLDHAVTTAIRDLKEKLRRVHKKEEDFFRKGGAVVKSFLRGFRD